MILDLHGVVSFLVVLAMFPALEHLVHDSLLGATSDSDDTAGSSLPTLCTDAHCRGSRHSVIDGNIGRVTQHWPTDSCWIIRLRSLSYRPSTLTWVYFRFFVVGSCIICAPVAALCSTAHQWSIQHQTTQSSLPADVERFGLRTLLLNVSIPDGSSPRSQWPSTRTFPTT